MLSFRILNSSAGILSPPFHFPLVSPQFSPFYGFPPFLYIKKAFSPLFAVLWNSAFSWVYFCLSPLPFTSLLFSAICEASSENRFAFLNFFFFGMVLVTTSCTVLRTSIHSFSFKLSLPIHEHGTPLPLFSLLLFLSLYVCAKLLQSCLTLCYLMGCSPPGNSVHGILQEKLLEWVAISYSRGSSQPRNQIHVSYVSCIGRQVLYY